MLTKSQLIQLHLEFLNSLAESNSSRSTVKNYASDLRKVLNTVGDETAISPEFFSNTLKNLATEVSPSSLRRMGFSIKAFLNFLASKGYDFNHPTSNTPSTNLIITPIQVFEEHLSDQGSSSNSIRQTKRDLISFFGWLTNSKNKTADSIANRQVKHLDILRYINFLKSKGFSESSIQRYLFSLKDFFNLHSKKIIYDNNPVRNSFLKPSNPKNTWVKRLAYRPAWWHAYRGHPMSDYLNWAGLGIITLLVGISLYTNNFAPKEIDLADLKKEIQEGLVLGATPPRQLSFQGRLTDSNGNPITTSTNFVFRIWNHATNNTEVACDGGGDEDCMWISSTRTLTPDSSGIFSVQLGDANDSTPIPDTLFRDNADLHLGITVGATGGWPGNAETLSPRQRIASAAYALNAGALSSSVSSAIDGTDANTINLTNTSTSGTVTVNGLEISASGTATAGTNNLNLITFTTPSTPNSNNFYGINFSTGYTDILRYNGTQLISGTGVFQNAGFSSGISYTNITQIGTLTSGSTGSGFTINFTDSTETGLLGLTNGGTNKNITASNGQVFYSDADSFELTTGGTDDYCLTYNSGSAPTWQTCASGATTWDTIGDPAGDGVIEFGSTEQVLDFTDFTDQHFDGFTFNFDNNGGTAGTDNGIVLNNAISTNTSGDINTESLLLLQQLDTTTSGTTVLDNAIKIDAAGNSGITDGIEITNSAGNIGTGINLIDTTGGTFSIGINFSGNFSTGINISGGQDSTLTNGVVVGGNHLGMDITTGYRYWIQGSDLTTSSVGTDAFLVHLDCIVCSSNTASLTNGFHLLANEDSTTVTNGILIETTNSALITDGIDISGCNCTNGLNIGTNQILASGSFTIDANNASNDTITITNSGAGVVNLNFNEDTSIDIGDASGRTKLGVADFGIFGQHGYLGADSSFFFYADQDNNFADTNVLGFVFVNNGLLGTRLLEIRDLGAVVQTPYQTAGTHYDVGAFTGITQTGALIGFDVDLSTNYTVPNSSSGNQTGLIITLKDGGTSATATGVSIAGTYDAAYSATFSNISSGSKIGFDLNPSGSFSGGTATGVDIGNITDSGATTTGLFVGTGWDYGLTSLSTKHGLGTSAPLELLQLTATGDSAIQFEDKTTATAGPNNPATTATNTDNGGNVNWTSAGNVVASDNSYATVALVADSDLSHYLRATNFSFSIPTDSTILGIRVDIEVGSSSASSGYFTNLVQIIKGGTGSGSLPGNGTPYTTTDAYEQFGNSGHLWNTTWTAADINASNFGVQFDVFCSAFIGGGVCTPQTARIDHVRITVYYSSNWTLGIDSSDSSSFKLSRSGVLGENDVITVNSSAVTLGAQANSTAHTFASDCNCIINTSSTAGSFNPNTNQDGVFSSAVYNGKLYVSTAETNGASVYRYDGGTSWTQVTDATEGRIISGDTTNIDAIVLNVYNGLLWAGSQTANDAGAMYSYDGSTWTLRQVTRGTFGAETLRDGVSDIHIYNGRLYISTQEVNGSGVYRYDGNLTGTYIWTRINGTLAECTSTDATDIDGGPLVSYAGRLYWGTITGSTTGRVCMYDGITNAPNWTVINTTQGTFTSGTTQEPDVVALTVYNGQLVVATQRTNLANIYISRSGAPLVAGSDAFYKTTGNSGRIDATNDTTIVDSAVLRVYNGRLYAGSITGGNGGGVYEFNNCGDNSIFNCWTKVNTTLGTFGAQTSVDNVTNMVEFNGTLIVGTNESNAGSIYTFNKTSTNSYFLRFNSGSDNFGSIYYTGSSQAQNNSNHTGAFYFNSAINSTTGSFDLAEDYPTFDPTLGAGEIVAVDSRAKEHVKRAEITDKKTSYIGIVSTDPGFKLSQKAELVGNDVYVPIALTGRVPVKVSAENGPIEAGDLLTLSSRAGVAAKAVTAGPTVGKALEGFNPENSDVIGEIVVFVDVGFISDATNLNLEGSSSSTQTNSQTVLPEADLPEILSEFPNLVFQNFEAASGKLGSLITSFIESLPGENITFRLNPFEGKTGKLELKNANNETKLSIDDEGNLEASGSASLKKLNLVESVGSGVIQKGQNETFIQTKTITKDSKVLITPSSKTAGRLLIVTEKVENTGFRVLVESSYSEDINFDWLVIN